MRAGTWSGVAGPKKIVVCLLSQGGQRVGMVTE